MELMSLPGQALDPEQQEDAADLLSFLEDLDNHVAPSSFPKTDSIALSNVDGTGVECAVRSLPQTDRVGLTAWAPLGHGGAEGQPAILGTNEGGKERSLRSMHVRCHWSSAPQQSALSRSSAVAHMGQPLQHQAEDVALLLDDEAPLVIFNDVPIPMTSLVPQAWPEPCLDHTSLQAYPPPQTPVFKGIPIFPAGEGIPGSHVEAALPPPGGHAAGHLQKGGNQEEGESCSSDDERSELMQQSGSAKGRKTDSWRANNRRAQKAFRERQKGKQRAIETALEEMSQRVAALEQEKEHLQTALESATSTMQGSKVAAKERSAVAVAVTVTCGPGDAPVQLTSGKLQALSIQGIAHIWKGLVRNMAVWFPEAERDQQGPHAKHLEGLAADGCALMWALVDVNPTALASFVSCNLEVPHQRRNASPDLWACVLERLQLNAEQQEALAMTRRSLLANVGALLADRGQIVAQAQRMAGNSSFVDADLASLVDQVHANAQAVQICTAFYISQVYAEVLTPLQCARFFHQCYPGGPDMLSLMAAAAAAANEPRASDIYQAVHLRSGRIQPSSEWRRALVEPISRMRCGAMSAS